MASAWGVAWASAWGDSWGAAGQPQPEPEVVSGRGNLDWRGKKKKLRVLTHSEFVDKEERARALAVVLSQASIPIAELGEDLSETELDDEILLKALTWTIH